MKAEKLLHRGEERIKIDFPYNQEIAGDLRKIPDCKWSQSHKAWHIPYTKDAFRLLKALFPDLEFVKTEVHKQEAGVVPNVTPISEVLNPPLARGIYVYVLDRRIIVKMPKNEADTQFITSLRFSKWDASTRSWNIPNYPGNTEKIKAHFDDRITRWEEALADADELVRSAKKTEVVAIKTLGGRIKLIFGFQKGLTYLIKQLPYHSWNSKNKWWTIPYSEKFLEMIRQQCEEDKLTFTLEEEQDETGRTARISPFDIPNYRTCPEEFIRDSLKR